MFPPYEKVGGTRPPCPPPNCAHAGYTRVVIASAKPGDLQISAHVSYHSDVNAVGLHHLRDLIGSISDETSSFLV